MKKVLSIVFIACFLSVSLVISKSEAGADYTGPEGCKCHKPEMQEWQTSKHGKAFKRLQLPTNKKEKKKRKRLFSKLNKKLKDNEKLDPKKDYSNDKKCVACHVIGYGKKGGFESIEKTPELANVGCENCHGPGSVYRVIHKDKELTFTRAEAKAAGATYGSEDEKVCRACHDNPDSPMRSEIDEKYKFDWKEFISLEKTFHTILPLKGKH